MSDDPESNIYPTSAIQKKDRDVEMFRARQDIQHDFGKDWLYLNELSKPKEPDLMLDVEVAARINITQRHQQFGIDPNEIHFPTVFVIPSENWNEAIARFSISEEGVDGFVTPEGESVVVKEGESVLLTAYTMYHEMMHSVGRVAHVVAENSYRRGQLGFMTAGHVLRGKALEEGVVDYEAFNFALNCDIEQLNESRNEAIKHWVPHLKEEPSQELMNTVISSELMISSGRKYNIARNMVTRMIKVGGEEMEGLLLTARIDTSQKKELSEKINAAFNDKETAKKIFGTQFNEESLSETMHFLYERMNK